MKYLQNYSEFAKNISSLSLISVFIVLINSQSRKWLNPEIKQEFKENVEPLVDVIESGKTGYLPMPKDKFPKTLIAYFEEAIKKYEKIKGNL